MLAPISLLEVPCAGMSSRGGALQTLGLGWGYRRRRDRWGVESCGIYFLMSLGSPLVPEISNCPPNSTFPFPIVTGAWLGTWLPQRRPRSPRAPHTQGRPLCSGPLPRHVSRGAVALLEGGARTAGALGPLDPGRVYAPWARWVWKTRLRGMAAGAGASEVLPGGHEGERT